MKRFFKSIKQNMTAYEIFLMLISAIVGSIFSLIGELNGKVSIIVFIIIILVFLIATIIIQIVCDRFNILSLMKKFNKNKQYKLTIMLGVNLSSGLWHTYKLSQRVKIGEQVKIACEKSLTDTSTYYDTMYILANFLIDDLGYTNVILDNAKIAYQNINYGIEKINTVLKMFEENNCTNKDMLKFKMLKLKAYRHEMGMLDKIKSFSSEKERDIIISEIREEFKNMFLELGQIEDIKGSDALLCAEYAMIKDDFQKIKENTSVNNKDLNEINQLLKKLYGLKDRINKIGDKVRCEEWNFKCERLKWEIQLFLPSEDIICKNYHELLKKITNPTDKTVNRYIDVYKRFLLYSKHLICNLVDSLDVNNIDGKIKEIDFYKKDLKLARKNANEFLDGCDAKKQISENKKINKDIDYLLEKKLKYKRKIILMIKNSNKVSTSVNKSNIANILQESHNFLFDHNLNVNNLSNKMSLLKSDLETIEKIKNGGILNTGFSKKNLCFKNNSNDQTVFLIMGAIGSGKTSLANFLYTQNFFNDDFEFLSVDLIKKEFFDEFDSLSTAYSLAKIFCNYRLQYLMKNGKNFVFELVPSTDAKLKMLQSIKKCGYKVVSIYLFTSDDQININRVEKRIALGADFVSTEKVKNSLVSTSKHLKKLVSLSNSIYFINSSNGEFKLIGSI